MIIIFELFEITHWQHPRFHAYFPAGNSYPSLLAEMLSNGLGVVGFSWAASPACTELEIIVLNWLGKMLGLPKYLLPYDEKETETPTNATNGFDDDEVLIPSHTGGGVILVN